MSQDFFYVYFIEQLIPVQVENVVLLNICGGKRLLGVSSLGVATLRSTYTIHHSGVETPWCI
jgi:hypothetical protein